MKKIILLFILLFVTSCKSSEEIKIVNDFVPTIGAYNEIIYIDADTDYDVYSNIYSNLNDNGVINCNNDIQVGENIIACNVIADNGNSASVEYKVIKSVTYNKKAIFFGDSIVRGVKPEKYSWATYIGDNYDLSESVNAGIGDYRLSTYDDPNKWLVSEVNDYIDNEYDFVIMQGGINDLFNDTPIGEKNTYDPNTFIGGLEIYLKTVCDRWPNTRIGYIVTYPAPNYTERSLTWNLDEYKMYNDIVIDVLNDWHIPYLDLSSDFYFDLLKIGTNTYLSDYLHPNHEGYDLISPYIYDWMITLDKYNK